MTLIARITAVVQEFAKDVKSLNASKQKKVTVIPITENTTLSEMHNGTILHITNTCNITKPRIEN